MRKGITPVIAIILLVLIVVALGGVFAAWMSRSMGTLTKTGQEQITKTAEQLQKSISIDEVSCTASGTIYLRNTGTVNITCSEINVYVDDVLQTITCNPDPVTSGSTTTINGSTSNLDLSGNPSIKVTVPGNAATYQC